MFRIHVDFNEMTPDRTRVQINKHLYARKLEELGAGTRVILFTPNDIEVEGVLEVEKDANSDWWYGVIDWATLRDLDP